jgi:8-oxo-dGTP pyrophosphatase MutT (NUDIX family)
LIVHLSAQMNFENKINALQLKINQGLPGEKAQYKMAPRIRKSMQHYLKQKPAYKNSSVLILIYPKNNEWHIVLTERNVYPGTHSGQISLPGGQFEKQDQKLENTALRETEEEIGVSGSDITLLGALSKLYIPPSNFMVFPFVGYLNYQPVFKPDPGEVQSIIEIDVNSLQNPELKKEKPLKLSTGQIIQTPYFDIQGHTVWGATAMILSEFAELI